MVEKVGKQNIGRNACAYFRSQRIKDLYNPYLSLSRRDRLGRTP